MSYVTRSDYMVAGAVAVLCALFGMVFGWVVTIGESLPPQPANAKAYRVEFCMDAKGKMVPRPSSNIHSDSCIPDKR
jgi:hypothetical protein